MAAPLGNKYWQMGDAGRKALYDDPIQLWEECIGYFEWVESNPLKETKVFQYQGKVVEGVVNKMRAMTQNGLCLYLGISEQTWRNYCEKEAFFEVTEKVNHIIREQKFTGAAADLLNANIIARDLGLSDKIDQTNTGGVTVTISNADDKMC